MSNSPSNNNFDLSSVFQVQSNYLNDMSDNDFKNVDNSAEAAKYVYDLQNKLEETSKVYDNANTSSGAVLTEQNKVMTILENEQKRLDQKQEIVDNAMILEERKDMFTNTQRLQYTAYTKMMLVIILCLCIHVGLRLISGSSSDEPMNPGSKVVLNLLHVANIIICGIVVIYMYMTIQSRSELNYNQLNIPPPNADEFETTEQAQTQNYDHILNSLGLCYGEGCCGNDTQWNQDTGTCVPKTSTSSPSESSKDENSVSPNTDTSNLGKGIQTTIQSPSEGFATYNEIYNVGNELLPCKIDYPYKDSSFAQPNDSMTYMKSYR